MKNRNIFWGLIFIFAAVFVLLSNFGYFENLNITRILISLILVYFMIKNMPQRNFFGILIPAACICIMYDEELHLTALTPFPILAAAILGSFGLSFIFPKQPYIEGNAHFKGDSFFGNKTVDHLNESDVNCNVCFGETTKYIDTPNFRRAYLKCSFGSLKVFFDHAQIEGDSAEIYVDNSFGETEIYLPKDWNVNMLATATFGDIKEIHKTAQAGAPYVTIRGTVSFGDCKIYYI